jgi:hypothetical protein
VPGGGDAVDQFEPLKTAALENVVGGVRVPGEQYRCVEPDDGRDEFFVVERGELMQVAVSCRLRGYADLRRKVCG